MKKLGSRSVFVLLLLACASAPPLRAQAGLLVPTSSGEPDADVLSLREMEIQIGVARGYARVSVRQVFENQESTKRQYALRQLIRPVREASRSLPFSRDKRSSNNPRGSRTRSTAARKRFGVWPRSLPPRMVC